MTDLLPFPVFLHFFSTCSNRIRLRTEKMRQLSKLLIACIPGRAKVEKETESEEAAPNAASSESADPAEEGEKEKDKAAGAANESN